MSTLPWRTALVVGALVLGLTGCESPTADVQPTTGVPTERVRPVPAPTHLGFRPAHYDGWLNRIPRGLPLGTGWTSYADRSHTRVSLTPCGDDVFGHRGDAIDTRNVSAAGPESDDRRGVLLFADDRAAASYLRGALERAQACPTDDHGEVVGTTEVRRSHLGPRFTSSFVAVHTASEDGRPSPVADWWEAARFGNAVLLTSLGGQATPDDVDQAIKDHHRELRPLVRSMCAFTAEGCRVADPDISTSFPLLAGYPSNAVAEMPGFGREGPSRALTLGRYELCGRHSSLPTSRDQIGAAWANPEDYRARYLLTFPDATTASSWIGNLRAFWAGCHREPTGAGFVGIQTIRRTAVGGESWALVRHFRYHGAPGIGLDVAQLVRLGRAVLVDEVSSEGGAGPELEAEISGVLEGMTKASRAVVAAMCPYTEAGCPRPARSILLGPDSAGPVVIGMDRAELEVLGARVTAYDNGTGCSGFSLSAGDHRITGDLSPDSGVVMLTASGGVTPEGIGALSPAHRAYAAYPAADHRDGQLFTPAVPGHPGLVYRFEIAEGRVDGVLLVDPAHGCNS